MSKVFVFDHSICSGCYNCQIACKDEHCGNEWLPYAKSQPMTGSYWMKLDEATHGQAPRVHLEYRPMPCQHCTDAPCMEASDALYRRDDGLVILDPEKAVDKTILKSCPYGAIYWNDEINIAQKCTGCAHLVDAGEVPHCVDACPFGALKFGDEEEFVDLIVNAELCHPEYGTQPNVYYLNMPHLFAAGGVWDPGSDEVIIGAKITLVSGDKKWETESDEFGDFWFRKIDAGDYRLFISADGFKDMKRDFALTESLNLGDLALEK